MLKAAFILAASASALGLATLAAAQDPADEQYLPVAGDGPWYLQRSTCTLAHNDDDSGVTAWFRIGLGGDVEFADRRLQGVRTGEPADLALTVDGARQEVYTAQGMAYEDGRNGYQILGASELIDRIGSGRRLEVRSGAQTVLLLDLAGAGPAIAAARTCYDEAGEMPLGHSGSFNGM